MDWYYAIGGDRRGPVDEQSFDELVRLGNITPDTLVWRDGMADWQPLKTALPAAPSPAPVTAPSANPSLQYVSCSQCGRMVLSGDVVNMGGKQFCAACKTLLVQRVKEGMSMDSNAEVLRRQYIRHEAGVKSVGLLYLLGGAGFLLGGFGVLAGALGRLENLSEVLLPAALMTLIGALMIYTAINIRKLKRWTRIPIGILSGIGLLGFPVGTLINLYILYLVFSQKGQMVYSEEYQQVIAQTPHIKYRTSILIWILLGIVLLIVVAGLIAAMTSRR